MTTRTFALLGSGEFEPWSQDVDRWVLDRADDSSRGKGPVLILPTASAKEGDGVFEMWATKGLAHYESQGIPSEVVPLKTRDDAHFDEFVGKLKGASAVFFSGGNPAYLASVLRDTPFWSALLQEMDRGIAYEGCSAGVACLAEVAPDSDSEDLDESVWRPGLGLFHGLRVMPHWDALDSFQPGLTELVVSSVPLGETLVSIDENTAIVGDGAAWSVLGVSTAGVYRDGVWQIHPAGTSFDLPL